MADLTAVPYAGLTPEVRRLLARYGLYERDWDLIRMDAAGKPHNLDFLTPAVVHDTMAALGREAERVGERYHAMILAERQYATLTGTLRGKAFMFGGTKAGTLEGEALRHFWQFKSFAVNIFILQIERMAREFVARGAWRGGAYAAYAAISAILMGALIEQLQQLRGGKDPRDMTQPAFWGMAAYRSGGLIDLLASHLLAPRSSPPTRKAVCLVRIRVAAGCQRS